MRCDCPNCEPEIDDEDLLDDYDEQTPRKSANARCSNVDAARFTGRLTKVTSKSRIVVVKSSCKIRLGENNAFNYLGNYSSILRRNSRS